MTSDVKSSKSMISNTVNKASYKGAKTDYEPMRHKRPSDERPSAVEKVAMIENIRLEREQLHRALSDEKQRNLSLEEK